MVTDNKAISVLLRLIHVDIVPTYQQSLFSSQTVITDNKAISVLLSLIHVDTVPTYQQSLLFQSDSNNRQ